MCTVCRVVSFRDGWKVVPVSSVDIKKTDIDTKAKLDNLYRGKKAGNVEDAQRR